MMKIGTYNGYRCYKTDTIEYYKYCLENKVDDNVIYIIENDNGKMVKDDIVIGEYDGKYVKDDYKGELYHINRTLYYINKTTKAFNNSGKTAEAAKAAKDVVEASYEVSSTTGLEVKEVNYSDYTGVVDKFFEELNAKG